MKRHLTRTRMGIIVAVLAFLVTAVAYGPGWPLSAVATVILKTYYGESTPVQSTSPDGSYVAFVNCNCGGATVGCSTYVALRHNWDPLGFRREPLLAASTLIQIDLRWQDERTLVVEYEGNLGPIDRIFFKGPEEWNGLHIIYDKVDDVSGP